MTKTRDFSDTLHAPAFRRQEKACCTRRELAGSRVSKESALITHGEMTQQGLAKTIHVTRQTVNAIELGKYLPSLEATFRITAVFGEPLQSH